MNARRVTRLVLLVEQELFTFSEYLSSSPVFIGVRVVRSLAFCVVIVVFPFVLFFLGLSYFDLRILITPLESSKSSN